MSSAIKNIHKNTHKNTHKNQDNIVALSSILEGNENSVKNTCRSLIMRGYAYVILPDFLVKEMDNSLITINDFFNKTKEQKKKYKKEPILGYQGVGHKESYRMMTGKRIEEQIFPSDFDRIKDMVKYIDKIMYKITTIMSPYIFPNLISKSKELDIPFFNGNKNWGLFDITKYFNDGTRKELNCMEHSDPGLLSISLRSTEPGLQLLDENNHWISPPFYKNVAIIWTGQAASRINPLLKPAIHRVLNSTKVGTPRVAMWHEICTSQQEHTELMYDKTHKAESFENYSGIPISKTVDPASIASTKTPPQNNLSKAYQNNALKTRQSNSISNPYYKSTFNYISDPIGSRGY